MILGFWTRIKTVCAKMGGRRAFFKRKSDHLTWEGVVDWIEKFPWESEAQKKSFLALRLWGRNLPDFIAQYPTDCVAAFIFQKDHEAGIWYTEMMGNQITMLQNEIKRLQDQSDDLQFQLNRVKTQLPIKIV